MKLIFEEFYCPKCRQNKWLKIGNICVDCQDEIKLLEISQIRKNIRSFGTEALIEN